MDRVALRLRNQLDDQIPNLLLVLFAERLDQLSIHLSLVGVDLSYCSLGALLVEELAHAVSKNQ